MSMPQDVMKFMIAFDQLPNNPADFPAKADLELGEALISEEVTEMCFGMDAYKRAPTLENLDEFVDGAIDTIYVILWTLNKLGIPAQACWDEVQRSNMTKLNADGTYTKWTEGPKIGKVKKPVSWTPPDLKSILAKHVRTGALS